MKNQTSRNCFKFSKSFAGYSFALLTALTSAISYGLNKLYLGEKAKIIVVRSIIELLFNIPLINCLHVDILGTNLKTTGLLFFRGLSAASATITFTLSLDYLSVGDVTAIFFSFPALIGIFARFCLKENCGAVRVIITLITFVGLVFVAEPSFIFGEYNNKNKTYSKSPRWVGIILSFMAALGNALSGVILRKLGKQIHFIHSIFYLSIESLVLSSTYLAIQKQFAIPCLKDFPLMSASAVFGLLSQIFFTLALQRVKAGPVSLLVTTQVLFAYIFQYILFQTLPTLFGGIGAALIFSCAVVTALQAVAKARSNKV